MSLGARGKLFVGLGLFLLLFVAAGIVGWTDTIFFSKSFSTLFEDHLLPATHLNSAQQGLYELRLITSVYVASDRKTRATLRGDDTERRQQIETDMAAYGQASLSPAQHLALTNWTTQYAAYRDSREIGLTEADNGSNFDASDTFDQHADPLFRRAVAALDALAYQQTEQARTLNAVVSYAADLSRKLLGGTLALVVVLGAFVIVIALKSDAFELQRRITELTYRAAADRTRATAAQGQQLREQAAREAAEKQLRYEQAEKAATLAEQAELVDLAYDAIFVWELNSGAIRFWNRGAEELYRWTSAEVFGRTPAAVLKTTFPIPLAQINAQLLLSGRWEGELIHTRRDGTPVVVASRWALQPDRQGQNSRVLGINTDITVRKHAEAARLRDEQAALAARQQSDERFQALVHNTSDLILIVGADGTVCYQSPSAQQVWGYPAAALEGTDPVDLVHPADRASAEVFLADARCQPNTNLHIELRLRHTSGTWPACEVMANNLLEQSAVRGIVLTCRDVSARKTFEQQLRQMAFHDALTGLANRALFNDRLERALRRAEHQSNSIAVLFLDIDNFKTVNDSLGHEVGDQLLIAVAGRLSACLRDEDTGARMGGDEFTVLLEDIADSADALAVAARLGAALALPFTLSVANLEREVYVTASMGVAVSRLRQGDSPGSLLRDADLALYRSKASGKARCTLFEPSMGANTLQRLDLETDLRQALERHELRVLYQPIVWLDDGRVAEVEALLRWEHSERGLILPEAFIPLAEETGLIVPIGSWVLEQACFQARVWHDRHTDQQPVVMSVNLSGRQFQQPNLVADVARIVEQAGLDPHTLKLEMTESLLMNNVEVTIDTMQALTALGIRLAIDDFGTGYSSLSYLKRFPVETIKIDRSFVDGLGTDQHDEAIVRSVVALAKTLGLSVTGEGVETPVQQAHLLALGCDRAQGYLFARPLAPDQVDDLLARAGPGHISRQAA